MWFKRNKKKPQLTWMNVTLSQFVRLKELMAIEDELEKVSAIAELFFGEEVTALPMNEFNEELKRLDFLKEPMPTNVPPKTFEINGRKYFVDCLAGNITTAQWIDFTNHLKSEKQANVLSAFIVPVGHKYNDGYDMEQVISDISDMPIPLANDIAFFFSKQLGTFMAIFQRYLKRMMKNKKTPTKLKEVVKLLTDLGFYRM